MTSTLEVGTHAVAVAAFREALTAWGREHFRSFPWRLTEDPYSIVIAEVMLHRTQARQVLPVYCRFIRRYADVRELAGAAKAELHELLYSLGLRWRTDLMWDMATELVMRFDGRIPRDKSALISLPGVSDYIASAVRCFAWGFPEPLIDTNTVRVVGRLFGLETRDSSRRNRRFRQLIGALVDPSDPRAYNYSLLDLGEEVCVKKRDPDCHRCPVRASCLSAGEANDRST